VPAKRDRATRRAKLDADTAKLLALWARLAPNVRAGLLAMAEATVLPIPTVPPARVVSSVKVVGRSSVKDKSKPAQKGKRTRRHD